MGEWLRHMSRLLNKNDTFNINKIYKLAKKTYRKTYKNRKKHNKTKRRSKRVR